MVVRSPVDDLRRRGFLRCGSILGADDVAAVLVAVCVREAGLHAAGRGPFPATLEAVAHLIDHVLRHMRVPARDAAPPVSEAFVLSDFGDVVLDEPRLVGVTEIMEVEAGQ